jgi:hypothetical protein
MGLGIVVGNVFRKETGKSIDDPDIWLRSVKSYTSGKEIGFKADNWDFLRNAHATGYDNGSYVFLYTWNHEDIGDVIDTSSTVTLNMGASHDYINGNENITYFSGWTAVPGFLVKNAAAAGGMTTDTLGSISGLLEFSKSMILAYRKAIARPFYRQEMLSSEGFMILAGNNFYV